ncbi:MAG: EF-P beta-lysylation protein EpmB [Planctomycetaceae bacterium]|nr:EF-P beta-lysylation protein EpmB [Planctomycetaceae bacterium]
MNKAPLRTLSHRERWQQELADAVRDPVELCRRLGLPDDAIEPARRASKLFPLLVPQNFLGRMRPGDLADPLLRQVLPLDAEFDDVPGYLADPVDDDAARLAPGLLQKYAGRALLITTGACAVHCRYCFRRHYPYAEEPRTLSDWEPAFQTIEADDTLHEVLLSGGDPLTLTDARLAALVERLEAIPHLRRLRLHTRLPIVLPSRVTSAFIELLCETRLTPIVVVHANHPQELTGDCADAVRTLVRSGITTLNQAVLLRGVNDDADTLAALSERLIDLGVLPYYLHQLDRVQGAAHFAVPDDVGVSLIAELRRRLPGYAVPQFVREIAGAAHKTPVESRP